MTKQMNVITNIITFGKVIAKNFSKAYNIKHRSTKINIHEAHH